MEGCRTFRIGAHRPCVQCLVVLAVDSDNYKRASSYSLRTSVSISLGFHPLDHQTSCLPLLLFPSISYLFSSQWLEESLVDNTLGYKTNISCSFCVSLVIARLPITRTISWSCSWQTHSERSVLQGSELEESWVVKSKVHHCYGST